MLAPKAFLVWQGLLQLNTPIEAFTLQKTSRNVIVSRQSGRSSLYATKGFGSSTSPSVDKGRQKSIEGLQEWAKGVGIL
jgi:hypothetical protein